MNLQVGDRVTAIYKTGHYYGEVTQELAGHYTVRVLAVKKHPIQGDLHHHKSVDVPFFHERKALSFGEQANIPKQMVKPFSVEIPDYTQSLHESLQSLIESLKEEDSPFSQKSLECLKSLYGI